MTLFIKIAAIVGIVLSSTFSHAGKLNVDGSNVLVHGYDLVSYFKDNKAVQGSSTYQLKYKNILLNFSSVDNKEVFEKNPDSFIPEFGGYCSYGVRMGKKFDIDPNVWKIVNKKLYLHLDHGTQRIWIKDSAKNIKIAERLWPSL